MNKKLALFPLLLLSLSVFVSSCLNTNSNEEDIDEEWKSLNETRFAQIKADNSYHSLESRTYDGEVRWRESNTIPVEESAVLRTTISGTPEFTDTVVVRYEGWYFDKEGTKVIFDSSENPSLISKINYALGYGSLYPNKKPATFAVNGVIDGWTTILQDMKTGEEREVCIPYQLGYGSTVKTYSPSSSSTTSYTMIPAYTTLFFNIRLLKIIPMKGLNN
jgi:FKBP-type peptidyl-prolyl cis-trans isomerase